MRLLERRAVENRHWRIAPRPATFSAMSDVAELLKEASKLDRIDRAELISSLLEDLGPNPHYVTDEEAMQRVEDLKFGSVMGLSAEDFWKACGRS